jgi:hypothetical protein
MLTFQRNELLKVLIQGVPGPGRNLMNTYQNDHYATALGDFPNFMIFSMAQSNSF